jgi:TRAP-type C4-dicarboxylate transport system substrate-binding protein
LAAQFYGPAPYMLDLKWAPLVGGAVITEKSFNSLRPETQAALLQAAAEAGRKITIDNRKISEDAIATMVNKHGLHVTKVSPEVEEVWRQKCEEFYPKIRGVIVPAETYDQVRKLLDEYRKQKGNGNVPAPRAPSP